MGLGHHDADDMTQDVFLVALRRAAEVEPDKERAFLIGTALRVLATRRRAAIRQVKAYAELPAGCGGASPEDLTSQHQQIAALDRLLDTLPFTLRTVLVLYEIEGLEQHEIATALGIPRGTVASQLKKARQLVTAHHRAADAAPHGSSTATKRHLRQVRHG